MNLEENWWWSQARRDIIFKLLRSLDKNSKILEIGCFGGLLIRFLLDNGFTNIWGIDTDKNAVDLCLKRGMANIFTMDGTKTNFGNEEFDVIIASDILEHVKNENSALVEWNRILKHDGKLIIFVPAFNFLYSEHDRKNQHYKRYSKSTLADTLTKANFKIERISYWNVSLCLLFSLVIIFQRIFLGKVIPKGPQLRELNPMVNKALLNLLRFENCLLARLNLPIGVSVFAVATR